MAITAEQVKELRERTGAGMMECKKALEETGGDMEKAIDLLRAKGAAKAALTRTRPSRVSMRPQRAKVAKIRTAIVRVPTATTRTRSSSRSHRAGSA